MRWAQPFTFTHVAYPYDEPQDGKITALNREIYAYEKEIFDPGFLLHNWTDKKLMVTVQQYMKMPSR